KCNLIFARESCGHDESIKYCASEAGIGYDGNEATKFLEEGFVKIFECSKDILDNIIVKVDDHQDIQTVGFIHSDLQYYFARVDRLNPHVTGIKKTKIYPISNDASQFDANVLSSIYIAWLIKNKAKKIHGVLTSSHTTIIAVTVLTRVLSD
ncbi:hypothetical protein K501DRAFT_197528, partial [Backusella circina FSU 941]